MAGLDDLLGSLTKQGAGNGAGSGGLDDLLGGLLGGGSGGSQGGGGGLEDILGGLLGGGSSGSPGTATQGMNMGAVVAALGPLLAKLLKGGGLSKMMQGAQASGLSSQADSWVGTGGNASVSPQEVRGIVGDDTVNELAQNAGISPGPGRRGPRAGRPAGRERGHAGRAASGRQRPRPARGEVRRLAGRAR